MKEEKWIKVGFSISPEDRVRIEKKPVHEYILDFFKFMYGDKLFLVDVFNEGAVVINLKGVEESEVRVYVDEVTEAVNLSGNSSSMICDIGECPDTEEGKKETDKNGLIKKDVSKIQRQKLLDAISSYESLIGVEELKKLCRDVIILSQTEHFDKLKEYFTRCAICISVAKGDGLTSYIQALTKTLKATGLKSYRDGKYYELKKNDTKSHMVEFYEDIYEPMGFDLTYMMEETETSEFRSFLRSIYLLKHENRLPIFRIPYVTGDARNKMLKALNETFPLIFIEVPHFSPDEYLIHAQKVAEKSDYKFDEKSIDELESLIVHEQNKKHFYGFKSMEKLVGEIIYEKNLMEVKEGKDVSLLITEDDLRPLLEKYHSETIGIEILDNMVGIEEVRKRIDEIVVQIEMSKNLPANERPSMHMMFTGNPGTGKTTIARLLGLVLKEKGLLSKGLFFERTGRDFVGSYIGETAPITNSICRDAYGSILFIDEAYSLYRSKENTKDFGREALDTLITQMENHRQDLVVIMAGYPDEMETLLTANPGLKSRIPYEIKFRNYKKDELAEIFMGMATKKYEVEDGLSEAVYDYFGKLSDEMIQDKTFSNARFVRNLYERTVTKAGLRLNAENKEDSLEKMKVVLTVWDFKQATESEEYTSMQEKKKSIGFI